MNPGRAFYVYNNIAEAIEAVIAPLPDGLARRGRVSRHTRYRIGSTMGYTFCCNNHMVALNGLICRCKPTATRGAYAANASLPPNS